MFAPKIILVPTDFSEHSDKAIRQAADIAEQNDAKVVLLHVVDKVQQCAVDYCISEEAMTKAQTDGAGEATRRMHEEVQKLLQSRKIDVTFGVKVGVPFAEILQQQIDRKADLIVIGSHGRTGIKRALLGSVAEKVAREANCPVLLVR
jgi:universal stress protein A